MRILLVGNYLADEQQSMQRYAELLLMELRARGHTVELLRPAPIVGRLHPSAHGLGKWLGYIDKFVIFPWVLHQVSRAVPRRIVHICDHSNAMYTADLVGVPHLTTCHDLLAIRGALGHFPQVRLGWTGRILQSWILTGLRRSPSIICVSDETKRQLLAFQGFEGKRIAVVPNGLNHPYAPMTEAQSRAIFMVRPELAPFVDRSYVFFVGGTQWYKNRAGVLRIFLRYAALHADGADLLFAGKPFTQADYAIINSAPESLRNRIHHVGPPDNDALNALYARARCLLFPSLEEGFGWPILEAMQVGCRVLTSNRPPMNEIAGTAANYIDPDDEAGASLRLAELIACDEKKVAAYVDKGRLKAQEYSVSAMMEGIIAGYEERLGSVPPVV